MGAKLPRVPVTAWRIVSYELPCVSAEMVPLIVGVTLYQMLCVAVVVSPLVQVTGFGTGSPVCVVAAEVSLMSVKGVGLAVRALAKLSLIGGAEVIVKNTVFDCPPPGGAAKAITGTLPPTKTSLESIVTFIEAGLQFPAVGLWGFPLNSTSPEPPAPAQTKPLPFTVRSKMALREAMLEGTSGGMIMGTPPLTLKRNLLDCGPLGFSSTLMSATVALANRLALMSNVIWFAVPGCEVIPVVLPFQVTTELASKLAPSTTTPLTVPEPANADDGRIELRKGPAGIGALVSWMSDMLRPLVAARRTRDLRPFKLNTMTLGRGFPSVPTTGLQTVLVPRDASAVRYTPASVATKTAFSTSGSAKTSFMGKLGRLPLMSPQVAPPSGERKTWFLVSGAKEKPP